MFIAEVVRVHAEEEFLDKNTGAFDMQKADLLAYSHGNYYQLGDKIGRFGFSVKKKRRKIKFQKNFNSKVENNNKPIKMNIEPRNKQQVQEINKAANIKYRVQISALHGKKISKTLLAKKYNLNQFINEDLYNGYYIYTVGTFNSYEEAIIHKKKLQIENDIFDAFIVKFINGKRQ